MTIQTVRPLMALVAFNVLHYLTARNDSADTHCLFRTQTQFRKLSLKRWSDPLVRTPKKPNGTTVTNTTSYVQYRTVHTVRDVLSSHRKKLAVPVSANTNSWIENFICRSLRRICHSNVRTRWLPGRSLKATTGILNRPSREVSGRFRPSFSPKNFPGYPRFARICEGTCLQDLTLRNLDKCLPWATLG